MATSVALLPAALAAGASAYSQDKLIQTYLTLAIAWSCAQIVRSMGSQRTFLATITLAAIATVGITVAIGETATFAGRLSYGGLNPIGLGRIATYGAFVLLAISIYRSGHLRVWTTVAGGALLMGAALTGSRAPVVAIIFALLLVTARKVKYTRSLAAFATLAAIGAAITYALIRIERDSVSRILSTNSTGREFLWGHALEAFLENPQGLGLGELRSAFPAGAYNDADVYAHNIFLEAASEGGVILLACVLVLVSVSFKRFADSEARTTNAVLFGLFSAALINAQFSSDFVGNRLLWVLMFLGLTLAPAQESVRGADGPPPPHRNN
ncbi:O-antigen ligase family protein [Brachybacterium sp. AOP24-D1-21]|uniref:O-antigen ligase family protein n=1 Tax=Brachybacterium sp. AOP24-D1-21 TaxID=3457711 RepID=UPI0040333B95